MANADPGRRPRPRWFLDTSAYLSILLGEDGSGELSAATAGAELLASVLLPLEARRNVTRLARDGVLTPEQYLQCVHRIDGDEDLLVLRDVTPDLCQALPLPAVMTPRTLDLVHLRTALWFAAEAALDRFVTLDAAQRRAALELGLPA